MPDLKQLVYASTAVAPLADNLDRILATARRKNPAHGITGLLLHAPGRFLQYLEGPPAAVNDLFEVIATDPRHREVRVLADEAVGDRRFGNWAMAAAEIDQLAWLELTAARWPAAQDHGPAARVTVEGPSGLALLADYLPAA